MACSNGKCRLCNNLTFSDGVTFAGGVLAINIPAGDYRPGEKVCLVVTDTIPVETTIAAPVVITIGGGTEQYPLTNRCCAQLTACALRTRRVYPLNVVTTPTGGSFRMNTEAACAPSYNLPFINGTAPAAPDAGGGA